MKKLDAWILKRFQTFSNYIQQRYGPTNFTLARWLITALMVVTIADVVPTVLSGTCWIFDIVLVGMTTAISLLVLYMLRQLVQLTEKACATPIGSNNRLEATMWYVRLIVWVFCIYDFIILDSAYTIYQQVPSESHCWHVVHYGMGLFDSLLFVCYFYFISCTPYFDSGAVSPDINVPSYSTENR